MSKARVRNGRDLLLKVSFTACAIIALAFASAQKAPAGEIPPLKQLVEAALRSSEPEPQTTAADTQPSKLASQAPAPAAIQVVGASETATKPDALAMTQIANALPGENALRNSGRRSAVHVEIVGKDPMPVVVVSKIAPSDNAARITPAAKPVARAAGKSDESHCLATAVYFEARGESAKGQKAVAEVVLARTRVPGRPKSICGVVFEGSRRKTGCQFSFTCDGASDVARNRVAWARAQKIAASVMRARSKKGSVVRGATFYHADYVSPGWASRMVKVAQIGTHIFYRPKRGRLF